MPDAYMLHNACDQHWDALAPSADAAVRHCASCQRNVYAVRTRAESALHLALGRCVAIMDDNDFVGLIGSGVLDWMDAHRALTFHWQGPPPTAAQRAFLADWAPHLADPARLDRLLAGETLRLSIEHPVPLTSLQDTLARRLPQLQVALVSAPDADAGVSD